jgi:hypothetical protein
MAAGTFLTNAPPSLLRMPLYSVTQRSASFWRSHVPFPSDSLAQSREQYQDRPLPLRTRPFSRSKLDEGGPVTRHYDPWSKRGEYSHLINCKPK